MLVSSFTSRYRGLVIRPNMFTHPAAIEAVRAYTWRELPGWGLVYGKLVGDYRYNDRWAGVFKGWVRGKTHGYEMLLDLASWSNRITYFTGRYPDIGNQILIRAILKPGDTFLDIGANEGMNALEAARAVGASGKVIAFEPNPGPAQILAAAIERNELSQIELREMGLADNAGSLTLYVPAVNSGEGSFASVASKEDVSTVTCPVAVGDEVLSEVTPALIKIGVEGFELNVLKGLPKLLQRSRAPISIEYNIEALEAAGTSPAELHAYLTAFGYRGFEITGKGRAKRLRLQLNPINLAAKHTFDAVYVHESDQVTIPAILRTTASSPLDHADQRETGTKVSTSPPWDSNS